MGLDELVWKQVLALLADPASVRHELDRRLERMRDTDPVRVHQERLHQQIATVDKAGNRMSVPTRKD